MSLLSFVCPVLGLFHFFIFYGIEEILYKIYSIITAHPSCNPTNTMYKNIDFFKFNAYIKQHGDEIVLSFIWNQVFNPSIKISYSI